MDLVLGNLGTNTKMRASKEFPSYLYGNDYDKNGIYEQFITTNNKGKDVVMLQRADLVKGLPKLKDKFLKHQAYAKADFESFFTKSEKENQIQSIAKEQRSMIAINDGKGGFSLIPLPVEVQWSPVHGISAGDYDKDGKVDLVLAGNFFDLLPEMGRYDANYGLVLKGDNKGNFKVLKNTGLMTKGQVRKMEKARGSNGKEMLILAKNNAPAQVFAVK
jgi:hypothetical protein